MPISFRCGSCLGVLSAKEEIAGKAIHCPKCKALLEVPAVDTPLEQHVDLQPEDEEPPHEAEVIPRVQAQRLPPVKLELADEEEHEEDRPRRKSSSSLRRSSISSRRKFKPKHSESRAVPLLLIGGGLMVLSAVVILVWMLGFSESSPAKPPVGWKEYTGDGFNCWIPEKINLVRITKNDPQSRRWRLTTILYTSDLPTRYSVYSLRLDESERTAVRINKAFALKQMAELITSQQAGMVLSGRAVMVEGRPGHEVEAKLPEGNYLLRLVYHDGDLFIQDLTISDLGSFVDPRARPFFESFHITR